MLHLKDLPHIGTKRAKILAESGYDDLSMLAKLSPAELRKILGDQISESDASSVLTILKEKRKFRRITVATIGAFLIVGLGIMANISSLSPFASKIVTDNFMQGASLYIVDRSCSTNLDCPIVAHNSEANPVKTNLHYFTTPPFADRNLPICLLLRFGVLLENNVAGPRKLIVSANFPQPEIAEQRYSSSDYPVLDAGFETCSIHEPFYFPDHPAYDISRHLFRDINQTVAEYTLTEYPEGKRIDFSLPIRLEPNSFIYSDENTENPYQDAYSADLNMNVLGDRLRLNAAPITVLLHLDDVESGPLVEISLFAHVVSSTDEIGLRSSILASRDHDNLGISPFSTFIGQMAGAEVTQAEIEAFRSGGEVQAVDDASRQYYLIDEKSLQRALAQQDTAHLVSTTFRFEQQELEGFEENCVEGLMSDATFSDESWEFSTRKFNQAHNSFRTFGIFQRQMPEFADAMETKDCFE